MLRNCPTCGRLLLTPPGTPCAHCLDEEDAAVQRISNYLHGGGAPTLAAVSQATGVKPALLRRLVKSGRIALRDGMGRAPACEVCGRLLQEAGARICAPCTARMQGGRRAAGGHPEAAGHRGGFYSRGGGAVRGV